MECEVCLEALDCPAPTPRPCGHVFCHSCISASLKNNTWTCPYCCAYLPSEGIPATEKDGEHVTKLHRMRNTGQDLLEQSIRYFSPYCQCEVDEDELMDHCLTTDQKGEQW